MKTIDGKRMKELLDRKQACAVDVDSKIDFKKSHILGATNIPYNEKNFIQKVEQSFIKKNENVVLCASKKLAPQLNKLGQELESAGFENVYQYQAGPADWKESDLNIQKQP